MAFGALLIVAGLGMAIGLAGNSRLTCDRERSQCELERSRGFGLFGREDVFPLSELRRAQLESWTRRDDGTTTKMYEATLETAQGSKQLSHTASGSRISHQALVDEVNEFLRDPRQQTFETVDRSGGAAGLVSWGLVAAGVYAFFFIRTVAEVRVNAAAGELILSRRRWWQRSGERHVLSLDEIAGTDVKASSFRRGGSRDASGGHRAVTIRLTSGEVVPLFDFESTKGASLRRRDRLQAFLADHIPGIAPPGDPRT